ncbi:hypothetical protein APR51_22835 [Variovorax paradoxus]|nr:hypothetical protein APR52_26675 [Variovorax paradoxus]KPV18683.1 hypothetical protein APR51_22835 [Variovorax paradoxus]
MLQIAQHRLHRGILLKEGGGHCGEGLLPECFGKQRFNLIRGFAVRQALLNVLLDLHHTLSPYTMCRLLLVLGLRYLLGGLCAPLRYGLCQRSMMKALTRTRRCQQDAE